MTHRPQASPKRPLLGLALAALLAFAALTIPALPKADSGAPTIAKKKTQKKITGKLTEGGYTVIALAANGKAKTDRAPKGTFKLRPPAKRVTLHLRASDGTYAGPIIAGTRKQGKRAIVGFNAGARLGTVTVNSAKGFAKAKGRLRKKWINAKRKARAKKGVPIGAGNFGRVKSKKTHGGAPGDLDLDGIADPLDIDDDGDKVLDNLDRKPRKGSKARASAHASGTGSAGDFGLETSLGEGGSLGGTANVNAGLSNAEIETNLVDNLVLGVEILPAPGDRFDSSELDCGQPQSRTDPGLGGLAYCTLGGTGERTPDEDTPAGIPFPECCDSDGDGFGKLIEDRPGQGGAGISPKATSDQIGSGDVLIQRVSTGGSEQQFTAALQYVFVTTPALVSYDDGQGSSATLSYPVPFGGPGTEENPFPVKAGPDGDVVLRLKFWRPQRGPIPPETAEWIDMGGLDLVAGPGRTGEFCGPGSYSSGDPNLALVDGGFRDEQRWAGFRDLAGDQPASADNTFTYRLNLTKCLESDGRSFNVGENRYFNFKAVTPRLERGGDETSTGASFIRE